jgi:hypothetical protein
MPNGYWFGRAEMTGPLQSGLASSAYLYPMESDWGGDIYFYACAASACSADNWEARFQACSASGANACPTF